MTPLAIQMLIHYYCTGSEDYQYWGGDFEKDMPPGVRDSFEEAVNDELLGRVNNGNPESPHYRITSRGRAYVEALKNVPLPEYRMPPGFGLLEGAWGVSCASAWAATMSERAK